MNVGKQPHYMHALIKMLSIHSVCGFIVKMHVYLSLRFYPQTVLDKKLTGFFFWITINQLFNWTGLGFFIIHVFGLFILYIPPLTYLSSFSLISEMFNPWPPGDIHVLLDTFRRNTGFLKLAMPNFLIKTK